MRKAQFLRIAAATVVCCVFSSVSVKPAFSQNAHPAFTVVFNRVYYRVPTGELVRTDQSLIAVRSDGSSVDAPVDRSQRIIVDLLHARQVSVDSFTESTTTYPLSVKAVQILSQSSSICSVDLQPQHATILGYDTVEVITSQGPNTVEEWRAPALGCFSLKTTTYRGQLAATVITAQSIVKGEPDPTLFEIPAGYIERSPSQVIAEYNRRHPGANSGSPALPHLDEVYAHHQQWAH